MNSLPQVGQAVFVGEKAAYVVAVCFDGFGFVASTLRVYLGTKLFWCLAVLQRGMANGNLLRLASVII